MASDSFATSLEPKDAIISPESRSTNAMAPTKLELFAVFTLALSQPLFSCEARVGQTVVISQPNARRTLLFGDEGEPALERPVSESEQAKEDPNHVGFGIVLSEDAPEKDIVKESENESEPTSSPTKKEDDEHDEDDESEDAMSADDKEQNDLEEESSNDEERIMDDDEGDDDNSALLYGLIAALISLVVYLSVALNCYFFCYVYKKDKELDNMSKPASTIGKTHMSQETTTSDMTESMRFSRLQPLQPLEPEPVLDPYQIEFEETSYDDDDVSAIDDASLGAYLHSLDRVDSEMFGPRRQQPIEEDFREEDAYTIAAKSIDTGFETHTSEWFRNQVEARKKEHHEQMEQVLTAPIETEEVITPRPESGFKRTGPVPSQNTSTQQQPTGAHRTTHNSDGFPLYNAGWAECLHPVTEGEIEESESMGIS